MKKQKRRCEVNQSSYQLALGYFREEALCSQQGEFARANFNADLADFWYEIAWILGVPRA